MSDTFYNSTDGIGTAALQNNSVTFSKIQQIATDKLIGRDTASSGNAEEISVGGGVEFTGTAAIQRSALTGDVTASAGSNSTTIPNDTVTYAKIQNVSATDKLLGRSSSGAGDVEEIACTAAGRALLDDANAAAQVTTLGLDNTKIGTIGFGENKESGSISTGFKGYMRCAYAGTITAFSFIVNAGTATVKVWKIANGTTAPTVSNSINTSGVSISSDTALRSTSLGDFTTTTVTANDMFGFEVTATSGVANMTFSLEITKT